MPGIRRREFITFVGGAAAAWPLLVDAQQPSVPVIGVLGVGAPANGAAQLMAFREGLKNTGYIEGYNVSIEYRWAEDHLERLPALASELVRRRVTVIVGIGGIAADFAAKAATDTIPIVFNSGSDPVQLGLVA